MIQSNDVLPHSFKADDANWPKQMFSHNVRNVLLALRKHYNPCIHLGMKIWTNSKVKIDDIEMNPI